MIPTEDARTLGKLLAGSLIERRDVKAQQFRNGAYSPHQEWNPATGKHDGPRIPWSLADLVAHIQGEATFGHYLVSQEGTCRVFCLDIDLEKTAMMRCPEDGTKFMEVPCREVWADPMPSEMKRQLAFELRAMSSALAFFIHEVFHLKVLVTYSGAKGFHVYGLLDPGTPAENARVLGQTVLDECGLSLVKGKNFYAEKQSYSSLSVELFPKQETVREGDGVGNLLRLPLGLNQKTQRPSFFVDMTTELTTTKIDDPLLALTEGSIR